MLYFTVNFSAHTASKTKLICACVLKTRDSALSKMGMRLHWTGAMLTTTKSRHSFTLWMLSIATLWCGTLMTFFFVERIIPCMGFWDLGDSQSWEFFSETVYFQKCWDSKLQNILTCNITKGHYLTSAQALDSVIFCKRKTDNKQIIRCLLR